MAVSLKSRELRPDTAKSVSLSIAWLWPRDKVSLEVKRLQWREWPNHTLHIAHWGHLAILKGTVFALYERLGSGSTNKFTAAVTPLKTRGVLGFLGRSCFQLTYHLMKQLPQHQIIHPRFASWVILSMARLAFLLLLILALPLLAEANNGNILHQYHQIIIIIITI